jgi:hypothetical protein
MAGEWPRVTAFVLDVSVTMARCFKDEASEDAWALLDRLTADTAIVPGIWSADLANVLLWRNAAGGSTGRMRELSLPD